MQLSLRAEAVLTGERIPDWRCCAVGDDRRCSGSCRESQIEKIKRSVRLDELEPRRSRASRFFDRWFRFRRRRPRRGRYNRPLRWPANLVCAMTLRKVVATLPDVK